MDSPARSLTIIPARAVESVTRAVDTSRRASGVIYPAMSALLGDLTESTSSADRLMSTHARTFRFAARFLPKHHRASTIRLYAFFRTLDDLVDEHTGAATYRAETEREIDAWQRWFDMGMTLTAPRPEIGLELSRVVREHDVDRSYFLEFLAGMRADLFPVQPEARVDVERYSYQVASTVGLAMTHVFDARSQAALDAATRLGIAMQLTNILRDVGGDLARGRLYLPQDLLDRNGLSRTDIESMWKSGVGPDRRLRRVVAEMIDWADGHYAAGIAGIPLLPRDVRMPILLAARLYQRILRQLESAHYDSLRMRAATSRWQKVQEACRCVAQPPDQLSSQTGKVDS